MIIIYLQDENLLDILGMFYRYGFVDFEFVIFDYLKVILNILNVCLIYDIVNMYYFIFLC